MPKQFVPLFEGKSLYQKTVERNSKVCDTQFVVVNQDQYFLVEDQAEEVDLPAGFSSRYLLEPAGRNTAPAIALACFELQPDDVVLVTPSDHLIRDEKNYGKMIEQASEFARQGYLVTFGVKPSYPETGFGYIEASGSDVRSFKEKPDEKTAQGFIKNGNYFWNAGIFCFKAGEFLTLLEKYRPDIYKASKKAWQGINRKHPTQLRVGAADMDAIPEESIDYAVMESAAAENKVKIVSGDFGWSDLGSFEALYTEFEKDPSGNSYLDLREREEGAIASSHPVMIDSSNNLVLSQHRQIALIDIEDLHIVDTPDALLVARRGSGQKVKQVVSQLNEKSSLLPDTHMTVHRPWGTYTVLEEAQRYKLKKIMVKPGRRLSLQKHHHRNEHWIVVSGTALVTVGNIQKFVRANESTYIAMGEVHRLENPGKVDLVMIEVQVGEYLGEDDIVRIEDDYSRE